MGLMKFRIVMSGAASCPYGSLIRVGISSHSAVFSPALEVQLGSMLSRSGDRLLLCHALPSAHVHAKSRKLRRCFLQTESRTW